MKLSESLLDFLKLWKTKRGLSQYHGIEVNGEFNYVLKIENIEQDFNALPFIATHVTIPKANARTHPQWTELVDPKSGRLINDMYKKDFEKFEYEMVEF